MNDKIHDTDLSDGRVKMHKLVNIYARHIPWLGSEKLIKNDSKMGAAFSQSGEIKIIIWWFQWLVWLIFVATPTSLYVHVYTSTSIHSRDKTTIKSGFLQALRLWRREKWRNWPFFWDARRNVRIEYSEKVAEIV